MSEAFNSSFATPYNTGGQIFTPIPVNSQSQIDMNEAEQFGNGKQQRPLRPQQLAPQIPRVVDTNGLIVEEQFKRFLENYEDGDSLYYIEQINQLAITEKLTVYVQFNHIMNVNSELANAIASNYYRYESFLLNALQSVGLSLIPNYLCTDHGNIQRQQIQRELLLSFVGFDTPSKVRDLTTSELGKLLSVSGTVTRTSEVRPELITATFACGMCNALMRNVFQQFKYTEPTSCSNPNCMNRIEWTLLNSECKFVDWQRVRIQENSDEIPSGSMPRTFDVIIRGEMVERAKPGDKVIFTGNLIVVPDISQLKTPGTKVTAQRDVGGTGRARDGLATSGVTGLKSLGARDLTYKLAFLASHVQPSSSNLQHGFLGDEDSSANKSDEQLQKEYMATLSPAEVAELHELLSSSDTLYQKLYRSIAPTVFGHEEIKKGILLQMLSGVHKTTPEGMKLRGDINVCIVGDPSTSKSQFLKYVCSFYPRSVYTSGKASSAAGLTASVVKDEESGDFTIEAGALMLADNGICAIDEFDKMDLHDQVAIHEAMEQQTISIAKAGVHATLNARASILAAANPIGGRYNNKLTLKQNIAMTPAIMSRFDLFFVVLDEPNELTDTNLATHIVNLHRTGAVEITPELTPQQILRFIRFAKIFKPKLTVESKALLAKCYQTLRLNDAQGVGRNSYRITVRQLESLIRLSEAIARAHCSVNIEPSHVEEASRLLKQSIIHVEEEFDELQTETENTEAQADSNAMETSDAPTQQDNKIRISREQYERIKRLIILKVQSLENSGIPGMYQNELVQWYLDDISDDLETEEELTYQEKVIQTVVKYLIQKDSVLLAITDGPGVSGAVREDGSQVELKGSVENPLLLLNPNLNVEFD